jgi:hypothetical protein
MRTFFIRGSATVNANNGTLTIVDISGYSGTIRDVRFEVDGGDYESSFGLLMDVYIDADVSPSSSIEIRDITFDNDDSKFYDNINHKCDVVARPMIFFDDKVKINLRNTSTNSIVNVKYVIQVIRK